MPAARSLAGSLILAIIVLGLAVVAVNRALRNQEMPAALTAAGIVLPEARLLPAFDLVDHNSGAFTRSSLEGTWTVLFAGFTHCPDICPTTLATLAAVDARLPAGHADINVVLLSLDPARDTPETLAAYVRHFNPAFIGATGETEQIDLLMDGLGLAYIRVPTGGDGYTVDHSAALVLIDPRARVTAYFKPPLDAEKIAADLARLTGPQR